MSIDPESPQSNRLLAIAVAVTALASGALYLQTLAPTVTGEDSGELIAAAFTLGIPHPPGYPLWCLTAHAAIKLIPFGEIAWRANLVSALFGVLAACTVTAIVMRLTKSLIAGVAAGLSFAFAHEVWEQSTIAEVYTQFAFLFALTLYLVIRWRDTGQARALYGAAFAAGLGVVAHGLMLLPLPVLVIAACWPRAGAWLRPAQIAPGAAAFLAPFLVLLYLPIRSAADPAVDWGNPESLDAFWAVMSRAQYENILTGNPRSLRMFGNQYLYHLSEFVWYQPMLFALPGMAFTFAYRRDLGFLLFALYIMTGAGSVVLTNFPIEQLDLWMNTTYWIPVYVIGAVWTGLLIGFIQQRTAQRKIFRFVIYAVAVVSTAFPLASLYNKWEANARSDNRFVYEYAENVLLTLPENAIYIGGGDHTIFPLLYLTVVERKRPDITIANPYGYIDMARVEGLRDAFPGEARNTIPSEASEPLMVEWLANHSGRPVYTADPLKLEGFRCVRYGVLYRVASPDAPLGDLSAIWDTYEFDERPMLTDWASRLIQLDYFAAAAERDILLGKPDQARIYLMSAMTFAHWTDHYGGGSKHAFNNLAILAARGGMADLAEEFWLRALEIDPQFELARKNLERYQARQSDR